MNRVNTLLLAALCAVALTAPVAAQPVPTETVSLDEALDRVERLSPDAVAARLLVAQAEAERRVAQTLPNPTLGTEVSNLPLSRTEPPGLAASQTVGTALRLGQPLILWGKRSLRIASAEAGVAAGREQQRDALLQLRTGVKDAFFQTVHDGRVLAFATENQRRYQQIVDVNARRFRSGDISEVEFRKIELEGLKYLSDVQDAQRSLASSQNLLGRLVGADHPVGATPDLIVPDVTADEAALLQRAYERRADLAAVQRQREQASLALDLARRERYPDITVGVGYTNSQFVQGGDIRNTAGVGFSVPLPLLNQNQGAIARAEVALRQLDATLAQRRLDVAREVRDAVAAYRSARTLRQTYEAGYLERAQIAVSGAEASYRLGGASLLELLDAERTYTTTQTDYLNTVLTSRLGVAAIEQAVGGDLSPP